MKKLLFLIFFVFLFACKKEATAPEKELILSKDITTIRLQSNFDPEGHFDLLYISPSKDKTTLHFTYDKFSIVASQGTYEKSTQSDNVSYIKFSDGDGGTWSFTLYFKSKKRGSYKGQLIFWNDVIKSDTGKFQIFYDNVKDF